MEVFFGAVTAKGYSREKYRETCDLVLEYWEGRVTGRYIKTMLGRIVTPAEMGLISSIFIKDEEAQRFKENQLNESKHTPEERAKFRKDAVIILEKHCPIFEALNEDGKSAFIHALEVSVVEPDAHMHTAGDEELQLTLVMDGVVHTLASNGLGNLVEVSQLGPGAVFGSKSIMPQRGTYDLTYFAGQDGATMLIMKVDTFEKLLATGKVPAKVYDALVRKKKMKTTWRRAAGSTTGSMRTYF